MKKIFFIFGLFLFFSEAVFLAPKEPLRVSNSALVEGGYLQETVVLTDNNGEIFLEMPKALKIMHADTKTPFSGEILSPLKTEIPAQSPKARMKDLYSFELLGDVGEELLFTDRISTLHPKNRLKEVLLNEDEIASGDRPKLLFVLQDESVRNPRLWRFLNEKDGWSRIGGIVKDGGEKRIFTAKIFLSGKYTIFDENPISTDFAEDYAPQETIESVSSKIKRLEDQLLEMKRSQGLLEDENEASFDLPDSVEDEILFESQELFEIPSLEDPNQKPQEKNTETTKNSDESIEDDQIVPALDPETGLFVFPSEKEENVQSLGAEAERLNSQIEIPENASLSQTGIDSKKSSSFSLWIFLGIIFVLLGGGAIMAFRKNEY